jgi:hypothetical protein
VAHDHPGALDTAGTVLHTVTDADRDAFPDTG